MPVINPIWFYLISVCDTIKLIAIVVTVISLAIAVTCFAMSIDYDEPLRRDVMKKLFITGVIAMVVVIFCPSQTTLEKMLIAQNVTYERIEQATDVVSNVYEDIMDLFEKDEE